MGKITKTLQTKHKETLSPWLKDYVDTTSTTPLPLLPERLNTFPSRWPFGRGDLYHWIPLLNRFDTILEAFCKLYKLGEGPQTCEFRCSLLQDRSLDASAASSKDWSDSELQQQGFPHDGDQMLVESILSFTRLLLEHCGNRSIYASSAHLNDLLNSTSLPILIATLEVGSELAQRYQASIKRIGHASRHISTALLANHYNIDVERVQHIAQVFVKTPIVSLSDTASSATPASSGRGRDKYQANRTRDAAATHANDLMALASSDNASWNGWGDIKLQYYPDNAVSGPDVYADKQSGSAPSTPTPLRRSTTAGASQQTPKSRNTPADDLSPVWARTPGVSDDQSSGQRSFELPQQMVLSKPVSELMEQCPEDMPAGTKYEVFNRLRVARALLGDSKSRQQILALRLLAITNLSYIHNESTFVEKVLRHDMDESRRHQLVYQLADLIHPPTDQNVDVPLWLQTIALALLEAISGFQARCQDVLSALNANVNHGVLLYVIRKAVAGMEEDEPDNEANRVNEIDDWRNNLFSLTLNICMATRVGSEMASAGLMEILVQILNMRSTIAQRHHSMVLAFLDGLIWAFPNAFTSFFSAEGLDAVSNLVVDAVTESDSLLKQSKGIAPNQQSSAVDYTVPYYQQQTLKWLLKFVHRIMSNTYNYNGNTDRLLRNLSEKSDLLGAVRHIIQDKQSFGSVVWTNCIMILSDFINNDPTSFAAISESGMIKTYLEAVTGTHMPDVPADGPKSDDEDDPEEPDSIESSSVTAMIEQDERPHPPSEEVLRAAEQPTQLAAGILPSSDAINAIPQVLNSICLNKQGMKMVVASRAFDSFFQVFESARHLKCMDPDSDLPSNIGSNFDELARHHPPLRTAISNSVIDMVARVRLLAIRKAEVEGWGAKLLMKDDAGRTVSVTKDGRLEEVNADSKKVDGDNDVSMSGSSDNEKHEDNQHESPYESTSPYIFALATFLNAYLANSVLKASFVEKGGIELLLDLCEAPSLPATYGDSAASRILASVLTILIEHSPVRGLPSLLRRAQSAIDDLRPLAEKTEALPPLFGPFLSADFTLTPAETPAELSTGNTIVKSLLNAQTFIKIISECFANTRPHTIQFLPVNVYDYYLALIKTIGPVMRGVLAEEAGELSVVPQNWSLRRRDAATEDDRAEASMARDSEDSSLSEVMTSTGSWKPTEGHSADNRPTDEERASTRYKNYELLRVLLHPMIPTSFPFFQSLGKALIPRREVLHGDLFPRPRHLEIAKALADTVLAQLRPSVSTQNPTSKEFHYWIIMLHTIHEMLTDHANGRHPDRSNIQILIPVLLAFKEQGGIDVLNKMLKVFAASVKTETAANTEESSKSKVAAFGLKKILDLYLILANGKYITEASNYFSLQRQTDRSQTVPHVFQQIVVELRAAIILDVLSLWTSEFFEHVPVQTVKRLIDILKLVSLAEHEPPSTPKSKASFALLKYTDARFNWRNARSIVREITNAGYDEALAYEATYRANGNGNLARDYCRAHKAGLAGPPNPIPAEDVDKLAAASGDQDTGTSANAASEADRMSVDAADNASDDAGGQDAGHHLSAADRTSSQESLSSDSDASSSAVSVEKTVQQTGGSKERLDEIRLKLRDNLIDQCLDAIRAHPSCAIEVSELINAVVLKTQNKEAEEEVGDTLTFALSSLALDDKERKRNGKCIAAYSHLLALLLQDDTFFSSNIETLKGKAEEYMVFLKLPPSSSEEMPPWIPYILLILEIFLCHDERPVAAQWKAPKSLGEEVSDPVVKLETSMIDDKQRAVMLEYLLDLLPRIGKDELLATSILRILVILTRRRSLSKQVGEKKNLQRLLLMAKQLAGFGSERLKQNRLTSYIITVLRHVVEDEDTIKQVMRAEIKAEYPNLVRSSRNNLDVLTYLRAMGAVALRAPALFVDVTNEQMRFSRWSPDEGRPNTLVMREDTARMPVTENTTVSVLDEPVATSADNIKPSTEVSDREMTDAPKASESKRPVVENPDEVIHFLLCELVNYREVDDKEPIAQLKQSKPEVDSGAETPGTSSGDEAVDEDKDKKQAKPAFKADEHPIFVYRCFLLNCLAELLHSYTRAKVEFINFKRSAPPMSSSTPIKPRTGILNYLIYDLLCQDNLAGTADTIAAKKKAATSAQTQKVLVALVTRASEKPLSQEHQKFVYDEDADLLFVRKFVLDTVLRAYEKAPVSDEPFETRYSRMQCLAELMNHMIADKDKEHQRTGNRYAEMNSAQSQAQLRRLMYEKGFLDKLTSSIAEVNLNYPGVKRAIKYVLRVLRILTETAKELSHTNLLTSQSQAESSDEEFDSASSLSDLDDEREETPDLYRNSALGMLEPRDEDDEYDEEDEDEEGMYADDYDEEMDYGDEDMSDGEDAISDEDEEFSGMGQIEGLHGEPGVVEVIMDEDDDDSEDDEEDEDADSADMEDMEDRVEIVDEDGHPIENDSAWESDSGIEEVIEPEGDDDLDYENEIHDEEDAHLHGMGHGDLIGNMARAMMGGDEYGGDLMGGMDEHYLDEDEEDEMEEDEEDEMEDDDYLDDDYPQDHPPALPSLGWDGMNPDVDDRHRQLFLLDGQRRQILTRMDHRGGMPPRFIGGAHRDAHGDFRNYFSRAHRPGGQPTGNEDGVNPLLRRNEGAGDSAARPGHPGSFGFRLPEGLLGGGGRHGMDGPMSFLGELMEFLPMMGRNGNGQHAFHVHISGPGGMRGDFPLRPPRADQRREATQEPHQAVAFSAETTLHRYQEEARMVFGGNFGIEATKLSNAISAKLTPGGMDLEKKLKLVEEENRKKLEEARRKQEEEQRQAREAKEAEERAAKEKKEAEEREAAERAAAEAALQGDAASKDTADDAGDSAMGGLDSSVAGGAGNDVPRVVTMLRGEEYDITDLGIDPDYLAGLPEEFREEVIAQTLTERRSQAREEATTTGESTEVFQEFLDALPEELRDEIAQQEQQEQRRRHRDESRRQAAASSGQAAIPTEMDAASILLTFPPELREQVLLEQGQDLMDQLPPDMAARARALAQQHSPIQPQRISQPPIVPPGAMNASANGGQNQNKIEENKVQRKTVVQMLDKAGVATLLRLMFIAQQGSIRNYLFGVFADVCENRQNRLEVISTVLQILQDGTTDMPAVERSFGQLSIKARRHKEKDAEPRTPQNLKRTLTALTITNNSQTNSETSPLLIAQQCLDLLVDLCTRNPHIAVVFLTEHEIVGAAVRKALSRKGKAKDSKAQKYAINALLSLLDRQLVTESSVVMTHLADLLSRVTLPLQNLEKRRRESKAEAIEPPEATKPQNAQGSDTQPPSNEPADAEATNASDSVGPKDSSSKRTRQLQPPTIPEESLVLVVRIFVARECSSKTFQNTIATIKNLCAIPGTKAIFGQELIHQARLLSENIVSDLDDLLPHITEASTGTDIQGIALSKFSPGASEQNKLLRVLTALDHLFDGKKRNGELETTNNDGTRDDLLITLYHNSTFSAMWEKLSACLRAIRQRENMLNVATILLPLIESLMVVCKNTTAKDETSQSPDTKDVALSSPPPESQTANLFYSFTEEHRRILNELVRHSPKLMSGTFALLVKNPKVLEFDNKRNYFNRSVHSRSGQNNARQSYPSLQLSIRRDFVFLDSYKSLYFKTGDEVKFGKLNIRFHGEEGVDAGGVTREWFQVLARQMFDINYVLFTPVSSDQTTFHPNKLSAVNPEHLSFFKFIGRIIGKALYEGRLLDCFFSRAVYKRILGKAVSVKDMESFDPDYYKSLCWMLDNDITDIITETFSVEDEEFGVANVVDLKPGGRDIPVTEENKHEYVRLVVDHKLLSSVKEQMESFLQGFHDIIPAELISIFNEQELELLISGLPDIDIDDWRGTTEYQNYTPSSPQIQWFWRAVRSFDKEELAKLLQFVTGTSKVPLNGFKELEGMNGVSRFNIHRDYGNKDRLPTSHTCFNQLDLPEYDSYDALRAQLLKAITQGSEYFGFA